RVLGEFGDAEGLCGSIIRFGVDLRVCRLCGGLAGTFVLAGEAVEYRFAADSVLGQVDRLWGAGLSLGGG
ncbi:MAG TPA: hypothetical protein VGH89_29965, partial [Pseudonocardia sp.]